jgi:hypothetical protein
MDKERNFDNQRDYHARRTVKGRRSGSGVSPEQLEYSVGFSMGADYADAKSGNGADLKRLLNDGHVKKLLAEKEKSSNAKGFLSGFFGFIRSCKR